MKLARRITRLESRIGDVKPDVRLTCGDEVWVGSMKELIAGLPSTLGPPSLRVQPLSGSREPIPVFVSPGDDVEQAKQQARNERGTNDLLVVEFFD